VERRVKERLVGAAVLVAAAIILIPEMLSGPKDKQPARASSQQSSPLKTYTIDLNRSPGASSSAQLEERAPPPETLAATPASQSLQAPLEPMDSPENSAEGAQASPESEPASQAENRAVTEAPQRASNLPSSAQPPRTPAQSAPVRETSPAPIASSPSVPTSRGWAVQAGSFASKTTADRLATDLSSSGQNAFVMPVKSGTSTLYRVRIGPFADRAAANDALRAVKERVANAAVVAHP
jgi:DedD protein